MPGTIRHSLTAAEAEGPTEAESTTDTTTAAEAPTEAESPADPTTASMTRRGVRLIMRSLRAHPGLHATAMLGATGFVAATVGSAWTLGWITDRVLLKASGNEYDSSDLGLAAAMIIGISITSGASVVVRRLFLVMATLRTQRDWRRQLLHRYIDLPLRFHMRRPAGELLAHADADLEAATMVLQPLAFTLSVVLLVVTALAMLMTTHPLLALIAAVLFPTLAVMSRIYTRLVEEPSANVQRRIGEVSALAHESFDGALVVKTLGREPAEVQRMHATSTQLSEARIRVGRLRGTFEPVIEILPVVGTIALLVVGAWLVGRGDASPGDLVLASALFSLLSMPLEIVGFFLEEMPRSVVALERVDSVLNLPVAERKPHPRPSPVQPIPEPVPEQPTPEPGPEQPTPEPGPVRLPPGPLSLEIDDLTVRLGGRNVLDGASLAVAPGETVALVGSTGSGKSTLLETVAGLIDATSGSIRLGGMPLHEIDQNDLRNAVALVFQEAFLFADSIAENVTLQHNLPEAAPLLKTAPPTETVKHTPSPSNTETVSTETVPATESASVWEALTAAAAADFVDALPDGTATIVGERGVTLSGGQRQRVAFARALARAPRLLMLDDATSAVDPLVESRILVNLRGNLSATTIIVAHRLSSIKLADRVAYLADGRIAAIGTHEELLTRDDYRSLVTAYEPDLNIAEAS